MNNTKIIHIISTTQIIEHNKLLKRTQNETGNINCPITTEESEFIVRNLPKKTSQAQKVSLPNI